ncbi:MAG: DUF6288 domain-containing protein [Opitutales bacterium]|nr:DUF6288 domain-containing protein [Opitutales bacterium]
MIILVASLTIVDFRAFLCAQSVYRPKLINSKNGDHHDFPLGVLEATGRLKDGDKEILIMDVGKGGPAHKAGLLVGDRLVRIDGKLPKPFSKKTDTGLEGPQVLLGTSLNRNSSLPKPLLSLQVRRDSEFISLSLKLPPSQSFSLSSPNSCPKRKKFLVDISNHLVKVQQKSGRWQPGVGGDADVYTTAFCGLVLLANNDPSHLSSVKRGIEFVKKASIDLIDLNDPKKGPKNWQTASNGIFLAEYQLATGDKTYFGELKKCCDLLAKRVTEKGTMGHHYSIPYSGGGLIVINVQAHLAWALAEKCGYPINEKSWRDSFSEVKKSVDPKTGALGYSSRAPWSPDIAARTGAMVTALMIAGREVEFAQSLADALVRLNGRMRHAHAMTSIGLIYGFSGIKTGALAEHSSVLSAWLPYLELSRLPQGGAAFFGGKRNIGGDQYLGYASIGNAMVGMILASAEDRLFMHGGTSKEWLGVAK